MRRDAAGKKNYSWGHPQPYVQNHRAHKDGFVTSDSGDVFPIFNPGRGMSPNQSKPSLGGNITIQR